MSKGLVGTHTSFMILHHRKDEAGILPCNGGMRAAPYDVLTITGSVDEDEDEEVEDADDDDDPEEVGVVEQFSSWRRPEKNPERGNKQTFKNNKQIVQLIYLLTNNEDSSDSDNEQCDVGPHGLAAAGEGRI